ncbi:hypothetical protein [Citrobacter sedlakii]|uniref:hypothetical protein n=1 Tax=Citrobacter sedlakii TaxID=67826 RepID=UPI0005A9A568|nr:hypothetical protein [Citrobacter sedlakii]
MLESWPLIIYQQPFMKKPTARDLPTVKQLLIIAKERNIPLTEKKAKDILKRWKIDIERRGTPEGAITGNMEIFERYVEPGFVVTNSFSKTAYSIPRRTKKGNV